MTGGLFASFLERALQLTDTTAVVATLLSLCLAGQLLVVTWLGLKLVIGLFGALFVAPLLRKNSRSSGDSTSEEIGTTPGKSTPVSCHMSANSFSGGRKSSCPSDGESSATSSSPTLSLVDGDDTSGDVEQHPVAGASPFIDAATPTSPSSLDNGTSDERINLMGEPVARCLDSAFDEHQSAAADPVFSNGLPKVLPSDLNTNLASGKAPTELATTSVILAAYDKVGTPPTPEFSWCSSSSDARKYPTTIESKHGVDASYNSQSSRTPSFSFTSDVDAAVDVANGDDGASSSSYGAKGSGDEPTVQERREATPSFDGAARQDGAVYGGGHHQRHDVNVGYEQFHPGEIISGQDVNESGSPATPEVIDLLSSDDDGEGEDERSLSKCELSTPKAFWGNFQVKSDPVSGAAALTATPAPRVKNTAVIGSGFDGGDPENDVVVISSVRRTVRRRARAVLSDSDGECETAVVSESQRDPYALDVNTPETGLTPGVLGCNRTPRTGLVPWAVGSASRSQGTGASWRGGTSTRKDKTSLPSLYRMTPPKLITPAAFKRRRATLAATLFKEYNQRIFLDQLPADLVISWNVNLKTTAGLTHFSRTAAADPSDFLSPMVYSARVELSTKVIDDEEKLKNTLCHELCHAAAWLIDHTAKPPHGAVFKKWAAAAMEVYPALNITTCHQYKIHHAFRWQCTACNKEYGRHSNSIDTNRQVCGICKGVLVSLGKFKPDGTPATKRKASAYSQFVAANFASVRVELGGDPDHAAVMKAVAARWRATQVEVGCIARQSTTPLCDATNLLSL